MPGNLLELFGCTVQYSTVRHNAVAHAAVLSSIPRMWQGAGPPITIRIPLHSHCPWDFRDRPSVGRPTLRHGVLGLVLRQPLPLHWRLPILSLLPDLAPAAIRIRRVAAMTQQSNQR